MTSLAPDRQARRGDLPARPRSRFLVQSIRLEETGPSRTVSGALLIICFVLVGAIVWAALTRIDEVARTVGEVAPAGAVQAVQHLEGGIVDAVLVREGDLVAAGQPLLRLSPAASQAELDQMRARRATLALQQERLLAFAQGRRPDWDGAVAGYDGLKASQEAIHRGQLASLASQREVLESQIEQRQAEATLYRNQIASLGVQVSLLQEELAIHERLLGQGITPRMEYLEARRDLVRTQSSLAEAEDSLGRTELSVREAQSRIVELEDKLKGEVLDEAGRVAAELAEVEEVLKRLTDRVQRLEVRAPVRGIVKGLRFNTVNAVVAPGEPMLEIVPVADELVVEARLSPRDVGHVEPGQDVEVRVTSYDFARFGSVHGEVRQISASTFLDEEHGPYYRVTVALDRNHVGDDPAANRIIPGMVVEADIRTGAKSVLDYLLKPVSRGLSNAFRER